MRSDAGERIEIAKSVSQSSAKFRWAGGERAPVATWNATSLYILSRVSSRSVHNTLINPIIVNFNLLQFMFKMDSSCVKMK